MKVATVNSTGGNGGNGEERCFVVAIIGNRAVRFIEPATMKKQFAIANSLEEATRFQTSEQAIIRARMELTPSTFNVREMSNRGGWHYVEAEKDVARAKPVWAAARAAKRKVKR